MIMGLDATLPNHIPACRSEFISLAIDITQSIYLVWKVTCLALFWEENHSCTMNRSLDIQLKDFDSWIVNWKSNIRFFSKKGHRQILSYFFLEYSIWRPKEFKFDFWTLLFYGLQYKNARKISKVQI